MEKVLGELNQKAGESEKMKTAFINSMCHEIRTPLNAIVGFSGIITANAEILTSLIDHLLVVANLDSSDAASHFVNKPDNSYPADKKWIK